MTVVLVVLNNVKRLPPQHNSYSFASDLPLSGHRCGSLANIVLPALSQSCFVAATC